MPNNQSGNSGNSGNQKRDSQGQFTGGSGIGKSSSGGGGGSRSEAARKGGEAVSKDREHMSNIGRKGGQK